MEKILTKTLEGEFIKECSKKKITKLKFKAINFFSPKQKINKIENQVRQNLNLNLYNIYDEDSQTNEEMAKLKAISDE